jgi:hypothetical protein
MNGLCKADFHRKQFRWFFKKECSFLKKRTKKFCEIGPTLRGKAEAETIKSSLLLSFKKEDLSFLQTCGAAGG